MNLTILQGVIIGDPRRADLPNGDTVVTFDLQTEVDGKTLPSVPVEWTNPPQSVDAKLIEDKPATVIGTTRRRFYRAGGSIQTRVYVQPSTVIAARPGKGTAKAITTALTTHQKEN